MRKYSAMAAAAILTLTLTACASGSGSAPAQPPAAPAAPAAAAEAPQNPPKVLIAYFAYAENAELPDGADASSSASVRSTAEGLTGNTGLVARNIQKATGGDLFSIKTVNPYPPTYRATVDLGREEQQQGARPALSTHVENMADYDVIFLGYPNWWGDLPMALYTFLDEYDLSGKVIVPFCTHGGSALSGTVNSIRSAEPGAEVREGFALRDSATADSENTVTSWVKSLNLGF